ncbi:MAG: aminopeptidase P family protein [Rhodospirillales bacterium]|jgi:Xaa-Pro dipeptidase|nr:aminopeptidase P family protein [Rhodospirillales bacterium]MBT4628371.1 aminopeptidase P family protein [Rhodospirillales bacterium]MBT5351167.1 aminopeptidase P family protein [Rhodospirillales bacterium]MBT5519774.1 aminopeptidase P family protein [Rhodospirillales bacterium]MBT6111547.1 aminopeptidase P family protein [Rhodospirillales bacterium]
MGINRDQALYECQPEMELAFSDAEYKERLTRVRQRMERDGIDVLWLMAPESLYYISGYKCEWYQAQSPKQWPATSGIAIHRDHDRFIMFDTPSEQIMCRFVTCTDDVRIFPISGRRDGIGFIIDELKAEGWLSGTVGMEFYSYRPNPAISGRFRSAFEGVDMAIKDGSDILRDVRWVKSDPEIAYMEEAAKITDIGMTAARDAIRPGVSELDVYGAMVHAMAKAGGENAAITLPVLSGAKANTGHSLASRKIIQAGEQVNVDVCGVFNRYHANAARVFHVGEPAKDVLDFHNKSAGVFKVIADMLRPNLPLRELVTKTREYYEEVGIWDDAGWVGGYELGIGFPPDWVGNFVYEMSDTDSDHIFEPGTVVNFETQFFSPRMSGITYYIDTLMFKKDTATQPCKSPLEMVVLDA